MAVTNSYRSHGPELPGLTSEYFETKFNGAQALLHESLQALAMAPKDVQDDLLPTVKATLAMAENAALFAQRDATAEMLEARAVLGIVEIEPVI